MMTSDHIWDDDGKRSRRVISHNIADVFHKSRSLVSTPQWRWITGLWQECDVSLKRINN